MNLRILYHGLGMAGKTTNLEKLKEIYTNYVYDRIHQCTPEGRTVYLDMLSLNIKTKAGNTDLNVSLFTTPGQERFRLLRRWLFGNVDGVAFVVDATRSL
ncbi:MAG: ADP-ribosylation factor-like protein [Aquificaceae bacterium]|nr:ADP-ribosylation factor-like protein [Aquificaceae bacterium]MDW8424062.1 ADP-ribosylation factor-like protein [Aquificaceae bacterium]